MNSRAALRILAPAIVVLTMVGCSEDSAAARAPTFNDPILYQWQFTAPEVVQLFNAYACPGNSPGAADLIFNSAASKRPAPGVWIVATTYGAATMREATGVFVPDDNLSLFVGQGVCAVKAS